VPETGPARGGAEGWRDPPTPNEISRVRQLELAESANPPSPQRLFAVALLFPFCLLPPARLSLLVRSLVLIIPAQPTSRNHPTPSVYCPTASINTDEPVTTTDDDTRLGVSLCIGCFHSLVCSLSVSLSLSLSSRPSRSPPACPSLSLSLSLPCCPAPSLPFPARARCRLGALCPCAPAAQRLSTDRWHFLAN
jgi:hypothetical protein